MTNKLIPIRKISENLGITEFTLMTLSRSGLFPSIRSEEGKWYFSENEVNEFASANDLSKYQYKNIIRNHMVISDDKSLIMDKVSPLLKDYLEESEFEFLLDAASITKIFGSRTMRLDNTSYAEAVRDKSAYWLNQTMTNIGDYILNGKDTERVGYELKNKTTPALGFYDLGWFSKKDIFAVVYHGAKSDIVIVGTLQQFSPGMTNGLVIMEEEYAKYFFANFREMSWTSYLDLIKGDDYYEFMEKQYHDAIEVERVNTEESAK